MPTPAEWLSPGWFPIPKASLLLLRPCVDSPIGLLLMFGLAAHLADERTQPVEVFVKRLDRMSAAGRHWSFSDQP